MDVAGAHVAHRHTLAGPHRDDFVHRTLHQQPLLGQGPFVVGQQVAAQREELLEGPALEQHHVEGQRVAVEGPLQSLRAVRVCGPLPRAGQRKRAELTVHHVGGGLLVEPGGPFLQRHLLTVEVADLVLAARPAPAPLVAA